MGRGPTPSAWMKCTSTSPMGTVNWGHALSCRSWARQSKRSRQYVTRSFTYARSLPYCQPLPGTSSGKRARSSRVLRSASTSSGRGR